MKLRTVIVGAGLTLSALSALSAAANPFITHNSLPGFIVLPEQRFDPSVQRFMAEQSLRAMPLKDGQLFYIYPVGTSDPYVEQMQIRYLEVLLDEKSRTDSAEIEPETQ